jgi:predicted dehydrogenase
MVRVGIIGIGFMGMTHYRAYEQVRGTKVTALCSRDAKKLAGDWRGIQGNFGPPGTEMDLSGLTKYPEWQDLLADPKIDLVDICLPPAMHASVAVAALEAGKHVLVEKPITLAVADARRMVQAAEKSGKLLMIAHVLPFVPEYAYVRTLAERGKAGRLLGGNFKRTIAEPLWIKDFFNPVTVGGPVIDLHIHDAHFIRLLCGMPQAVFSSGRLRGDVVEFLNSQFIYDSNLSVTASGGVIGQQGRSFTHGFEIYFEKATLVYDFSVVDGKPVTNVPLTVFGPGGKVSQPVLDTRDAFVLELAEVARAVRSGKPSGVLAGGLALDALTLCQKQTQSVKSGKAVKI